MSKYIKFGIVLVAILTGILGFKLINIHNAYIQSLEYIRYLNWRRYVENNIGFTWHFEHSLEFRERELKLICEIKIGEDISFVEGFELLLGDNFETSHPFIQEIFFESSSQEKELINLKVTVQFNTLEEFLNVYYSYEGRVLGHLVVNYKYGDIQRIYTLFRN